MINEISRSETPEIIEDILENFNDMKDNSEMSFKEAEDFWKNEFHEQAEQVNDKTQGKFDTTSEYDNREVSELVKDYIEDLKTKSDCPDTINDNALDTSKLELQSPEKVAENREEFDDNKSNLRKEWEELNHQEWPTYKEDVINNDEKVVRKAGDNYDAHHIQPLQLGGENVASNITPLDIISHREIHSSSGSCKALVDSIKGGH